MPIEGGPSPIRAMRPILCLSLFAAGVALAGPAVAQTAPATASAASATRTLDKPQIDALLARPDRVLVIDVRRADEISTIGGFPVFLNVQAGDLERYLPYIPRDREIVTVSNHAHRAVKAGDLLVGKGFRVAGAAGVQDYEAQGGVLTGKVATASAATPTKVAAAPATR